MDRALVRLGFEEHPEALRLATEHLGQHGDGDTRRVLRAVQGADVIEHLCQELTHTYNAYHRLLAAMTAIRALLQYTSVSRLLTALLNFIGKHHRDEELSDIVVLALQIVREAKEDTVIDCCVDWLQGISSGSDARLKFLTTIPAMKSRGALQRLADDLSSREKSRRTASILAITAIAGKKSIPILMTRIDCPDVGSEVCEQLFDLGWTPQTFDEVCAVIRRYYKWADVVRDTVMSKRADNQLLDALLQHEQPKVISVVISAMLKCGDAAGFEAARKTLLKQVSDGRNVDYDICYALTNANRLRADPIMLECAVASENLFRKFDTAVEYYISHNLTVATTLSTDCPPHLLAPVARCLLGHGDRSGLKLAIRSLQERGWDRELGRVAVEAGGVALLDAALVNASKNTDDLSNEIEGLLKAFAPDISVRDLERILKLVDFDEWYTVKTGGGEYDSLGNWSDNTENRRTFYNYSHCRELARRELARRRDSSR